MDTVPTMRLMQQHSYYYYLSFRCGTSAATDVLYYKGDSL
ncbi:hypothetical protein HMPREF0372_00541 [Flavonifractor plautii ATCC 29863]|uniref:Uncharacterized protein n=1 Tax=Flavonifractor plautii ATCC 29863 TaxID=411475 RepID=G9YM20_FLAPL|nr:hypothetical protein HMPREF0372_00541 [Flavonifractor plautii ATCC 29863]